MPELGEGLHEGEIVKWLVKPGDAIEEDAILMEVQNDKAVVEVPSPVSGIVKELKVAEGETAVVGQTIALIETDAEMDDETGAETGAFGGVADTAAGKYKAGAAAEPDAGHEQEAAQDTIRGQVGADPGSAPVDRTAAAAKGETEPASPSGVVLATPAVRKLAREMGVAIARVKGSGKHGRITREDVLAFAEGVSRGAAAQGTGAPTASQAQAEWQAPSASRHEDVRSDGAGSRLIGVPAGGAQREAEAPAAVRGDSDPRRQMEQRVPLKGIRKAIAAAMTRSVYTAPHVTLMDEADVAKLVELRSRFKPEAEERGIKLTYLPFVVKALVAAVREYPELNASIDDERGEIVFKYRYDIGIATDTDKGLVVPVIRDADRKSVWMIAAEIGDLAARAREGRLSPAEMKDSTVTITNIGSAGGMFFTPVINWPESAILGIGRIAEKPVAKNGEIRVGQVMALSLSFDHRLMDGATAQRAVNMIKRLLEQPERLVMEV